MLTSLLDVIDKRIKEKKPLGNYASSDAAVREFLRHIAVAEKFDFGVLPCEAMEAIKGEGFELPFFKMPDLTDDEMNFWFDGLIPLPADVCWYEFAFSREDGYEGISGIIVIKDKEGVVWSQRVEGPTKGSSDYMIDGTWSRFATNDKLIWSNDNLSRFFQLSMLKPDQINDLIGSTAIITVYLTFMINSRTTDVSRVVPTPKQQSLRRQLKRTPLPEHTIVTIVPQRYIDEAREVDGTKGTHASPRIHWRRSHTRTYNRGLPNEYIKVIARMIVGRRELGEVKHDYVVRMKT